MLKIDTKFECEADVEGAVDMMGSWRRETKVPS